MKKSGNHRCLRVATAALFAAIVPLVGAAQEEVATDAQVTSQQTSQRRYVADKLVLNVYAEAESGSARVATIQTGDVVDELERAGNLVHVRLEDGREGWVGSNYLTSDAPAIVRLRELERGQPLAARTPDKNLTDEIALLKKDNEALKAKMKELQSAAAPTNPPTAQMIPTSASQVVNQPPEVRSAALVQAADQTAPHWSSSNSPGGNPIGWLIAVAIAGAAGFAGGYQLLARRLRKKFGALKIY